MNKSRACDTTEVKKRIVLFSSDFCSSFNLIQQTSLLYEMKNNVYYLSGCTHTLLIVILVDQIAACEHSAANGA